MKQKDLRDGQSYMNKLTKQWFDEVNQDAQFKPPEEGPKIFFKKSETTQSGSKKTPENRQKISYHHLNTPSSSNILLETSDDDESDDLNDEQIVLDQATKNLLKK